VRVCTGVASGTRASGVSLERTTPFMLVAEFVDGCTSLLALQGRATPEREWRMFYMRKTPQLEVPCTTLE
jgi:hypothetical protein